MSNISNLKAFYPVIIIGGGQAGVSLSAWLQKLKIEHLIVESQSVMHTWKHQRWDSFTLVTPNWQCDLPGHPYDGDDPKGFMKRDEIIDYLDRFCARVKPPVLEGVQVHKVTKAESGYRVATDRGELQAEQIVVASGGYHEPIIPRSAERLPTSVKQIHSAQYKNSQQLPEGNVLVVGSGQSGTQIAEDLHLAGKKVFLAIGNAPRVARNYRGKDVVEWLHEMGYYDISVDEHPLKEGVRDNTNHYVTGRDGGRDIDLRQFALEGMELYGLLQQFDGESFHFNANLASSLEHADSVYNNINSRIDSYIEKQGITAPAPSHYSPVWQPESERLTLDLASSGITSVIWSIGYKPDFNWLDVPVFNGRGAPSHKRGVTQIDGVYFIGLPWLHTWGSGRFSGISRDAEYISEQIKSRANRSQAGEIVAA